jgi:hypothetical protein
MNYIYSKYDIKLQVIPHRKYITVFATKTNQLMLFRDTTVVYYEPGWTTEESEFKSR